jgi:hypothetical protein
MAALLRVAALAALLSAASAVDRSKFRTCGQASFCKRHRDAVTEPEVRPRRPPEALAPACAYVKRSRHPSSFHSQFRVAPDSVKVEESTGLLSATLYQAVDGAPPFDLRITTYASGSARMRIVENNGLPARWEVSARTGAWVPKSPCTFSPCFCAHSPPHPPAAVARHRPGRAAGIRFR